MEERWVRRYRDDDGCDTKLIRFAPVPTGCRGRHLSLLGRGTPVGRRRAQPHDVWVGKRLTSAVKAARRVLESG